MTEEIITFLGESNAIEGEYSQTAMVDAEWAWLYTKGMKGPISRPDVLEIHQRLMTRLNWRIAGRLRTCSVRIGHSVKLFTDLKTLEKQLLKVVRFINSTIKRKEELTDETKEEYAKAAHIMFEELHPFEDGNGRVGRLIWNWHRTQLGLPTKIIYVKEVQAYYEWFREHEIHKHLMNS